MTAEDRALVSAMVGNMCDHMAFIPRGTSGMQVDDADEFLIVDSGLASDTFNIICRPRLQPDTAPAAVLNAISRFRSRDLPCAVWVDPACAPTDLRARLAASGLRETEVASGMVMGLRGLVAGRAPTGLTIRRVCTIAELSAFADVLADLASPRGPLVTEFYRRGADVVLVPSAALRLYVGWLDGQAVASSALYLGSGVAGLYDVATRSDVRGRGIGTAMSAASLLDAREEGYWSATLQASPGGTRVYARLGFRAVGEFAVFGESGRR